MKTIIILLNVTILMVLSFNTYSDEAIMKTIKIFGEKEISTADNINNILDNATKKASECRDNGGDSIVCMCKLRKENNALRTAVEEALEQHQNWKGKAVSYKKKNKGYMLSFTGLMYQFEYFEKECNNK